MNDSTTDATAGVDAPERAAATPPTASRRVVDAPTRMFHWLFAANFAGAWLTAESEHWRALHVTLGYAFAGLLGLRLLYGLAGPRHARLAATWRRLAGWPAWLRSLASAGPGTRVDWRQGQNLAMVLATTTLLALVLPVTASGLAAWLDGGDVFEELHEGAANLMLAVVLAHVALVLLLSLLRGRNQALPMLTGRAPGAGPGPVRHDRAWLAVVLLAGYLAFMAWQWRDPPAAPDGATAVPSAGRDHGRDDDDD